jgi:hypothetical protein
MQPHMRYELTLTRRPLYPPDIVHARQARAKPTVYAKDLASDDGSDRERVEDVDKGLPRLDVGTAFTLVVEPVDYVRGRAIRLISVSTGLEDLEGTGRTHLASRSHTRDYPGARRNFLDT